MNLLSYSNLELFCAGSHNYQLVNKMLVCVNNTFDNEIKYANAVWYQIHTNFILFKISVTTKISGFGNQPMHQLIWLFLVS